MNKIGLFLSALMAIWIVQMSSPSTAEAADPAGPPFVPGQIVLKVSPHEVPDGYEIIKVLQRANLVILRVNPGSEKKQAEVLRSRGHRAGLNLKVKAFQSVNDPYRHLQWHLDAVQADQAWDISTGSSVTVAVLDTGLNADGEDTPLCILPGSDVVNNDNIPEDGHGHGTHVAGTIAQNTANHTGVAGLGYGACLLPVKVLDDAGEGTLADVAEGVYIAVEGGAKVINLSLGTNAHFGVTDDTVLDPALEHAHASGATVVCAAGNDGYRKNVSYPAIHPLTISVGAVDALNLVARYSNRGTGLDLVAPGGDTSRDANNDGYIDGVLQETVSDGIWGYYFLQGTSMAAPHVAAAAAMIYANPLNTEMATPDSIRRALTSTAQDLGETGYDKTSGYGLLQARDALVFENCYDGDGDGWTTCNGDCNDTDAAIHPEAGEVCADGVDNNCSGTVDEMCSGCTDADADGWCAENGDCNDSDSQVYPGHNDTKGKWGRNGIDNDCNGTIDG